MSITEKDVLKAMVTESQEICHKIADYGRPPAHPFPFVLAICVSYKTAEMSWPDQFAAAKKLLESSEKKANK